MESGVELINVYKYFKGKTGGISTALDDVSINFARGKIYGVVGESGSGKTTVGRIAVGLVHASKGKVILNGKDISKMKDIEKFREAQYIHQDPYSSLDQYINVNELLQRPLIYLLRIKDSAKRKEMVSDMLVASGLGEEYSNRTIQELSGGERQRLLVARAFITSPSFVVADEPTTMIDFIHRKEIISIISNLSKKNNSAIMFISHDISVVGNISEEISVMYKGKIVESGDSKTIINEPLHPYTKLLLEVSPEKIMEQKSGLKSESLNNFTQRIVTISKKRGCKYADQCPLVMSKCRDQEPILKNLGGHYVSCFYYF